MLAFQKPVSSFVGGMCFTCPTVAAGDAEAVVMFPSKRNCSRPPFSLWEHQVFGGHWLPLPCEVTAAVRWLLVCFIFSSTPSNRPLVFLDTHQERKPTPFSVPLLTGAVAELCHSDMWRAKLVAARPSAGYKTAALSGRTSPLIQQEQLQTTASPVLVFSVNGVFCSIGVWCVHLK